VIVSLFNKIASILITILLLSACFGCHTKVPKYSDYQFVGSDATAEQASSIQNQIALQQEQFHSLKLLTQCELSHEKDRYASRYAFVARPERDLRIEQFPPSGFYALVTLVSTSEGVKVLFSSEKKALLLDNSQSGLDQIFGMSLPLEESDIGLLLEGILPFRFQKGELRFQIQEQEGERKFILQKSDLIALFNSHYKLLELHLFNNRSREELGISINYAENNNPQGFTLSVPSQSIKLECNYQKRVFNQGVSDSLFQVEIPSGYEIEDRR
jgi:hypothetical protein